MTKDQMMKRVVSSSSVKKAGDIRSELKGYPKPRKLSYKGNQKGFYPDVVAEFDAKTDVYCVEPKLRKSDLPEVIGKWILFSMEARKRKGEFYLVVPEKSRDEFDEIVTSKMIRAEILPLKAG